MPESGKGGRECQGLWSLPLWLSFTGTLARLSDPTLHWVGIHHARPRAGVTPCLSLIFLNCKLGITTQGLSHRFPVKLRKDRTELQCSVKYMQPSDGELTPGGLLSAAACLLQSEGGLAV